MPAKTIPLLLLSEMVDGQLGDFFVLMTQKESSTTRDGRPFYKVAFRDAGREVNFPIWIDTTWAPACRDEWQVGTFFKLRAQYRETNFGDHRRLRSRIPHDRH